MKKKKYRFLFPDEGIKKEVPYRNPSDGIIFKLERVNPDHVGIVWGLSKKNRSWIKFAKVYFSFLPLFIGTEIIITLDILTGFAYNLISSVGLYSICVSLIVTALYYLPMIKMIQKEVIV